MGYDDHRDHDTHAADTDPAGDGYTTFGDTHTQLLVDADGEPIASDGELVDA